MADHMDTPWTARVAKNYERLGATDIHDARGDRITSCDGATVQTDEANAAFIVRAVNAHDALVRSCQAAKEFLIDDLEEPGRTVFWNLVAALKLAIAS